jgi:hypothetical protein
VESVAGKADSFSLPERVILGARSALVTEPAAIAAPVIDPAGRFKGAVLEVTSWPV